MNSPIPILDLFAGPGGLGEGFSRVKTQDGQSAFRLRMSVEMDPYAHRTLTLRAFMREFIGREEDVKMDYAAFVRGEITWDELIELHPNEANAAQEEAIQATMGEPAHDARVDARIKELLPEFKDAPASLMIGGPPCQAYSLVGRARNKGIVDYDPELDHRHTLYDQYLRLLDQVKPSIFVMENVKGILSAKLASRGGRIFDVICADFRQRGYYLHSLNHHLSNNVFDENLQPEDFLLHADDYGVPQARQRVILVGIHKKFLKPMKSFKADDWRLTPSPMVPVQAVLNGMPPLRSGVSQKGAIGDWEEWQTAILEQIHSMTRGPLKAQLLAASDCLLKNKQERGAQFIPIPPKPIKNLVLEEWISAHWLEGVANHETRGHMSSDLLRYLFCADFAKKEKRSPTLADFPLDLLPNHANAGAAAKGTGVFADRFRVQVYDRPATTVTAHISKDGHYFIHPDPKQCRSLTVREAARLQTFPDDYIFQGPRTEQYRQVGNAVPPLLAHQIAETLHNLIQAVLSSNDFQ